MDLTKLRLDANAAKPLYQQLLDALLGAIEAGELRPGDRLLAERKLAEALGVSRTTVVNAYRELAARGLMRGQIGRGAFVCARPEPSGAPFAWRGKLAAHAQRAIDPTSRALLSRHSGADHISFAAAVPALDCFPIEQFRVATERIVARGAVKALGFAPIEGHRSLRHAIARRLGATVSEILVVAGAQQGLDLVARCLLDPGDTVIMDRPGYLLAIQTFRAVGAHIVGWDIARADLSELEDLLLRYRPKCLYTVPTFQNPTGITLDRATRQGILALAAQYRLPVIEDDPYRELYFDEPPPSSLRQLDTNHLVIQIGTFSKTLAAGLRLGWIAAAESIIEQLALVKFRGDVFSPTLMQQVVAHLVDTGVYDAHLTTLRRELARRHAAMVDAIRRRLPAGILGERAARGGLFLWPRLPAGLDSRDLADVARDYGVSFVTGDQFYADGAGGQEFRLTFGGEKPDQIAVGIDRLADAFNALRRTGDRSRSDRRAVM